MIIKAIQSFLTLSIGVVIGTILTKLVERHMKHVGHVELTYAGFDVKETVDPDNIPVDLIFNNKADENRSIHGLRLLFAMPTEKGINFYSAKIANISKNDVIKFDANEVKKVKLNIKLSNLFKLPNPLPKSSLYKIFDEVDVSIHFTHLHDNREFSERIPKLHSEHRASAQVVINSLGKSKQKVTIRK